ncbi:hypothetical protein C8J57DRAFT_1497296 [Mycena rebaudengoi]|nr:hypothetical protein C8J57DRAFT_1497296 [Mycena rebaudengoi]
MRPRLSATSHHPELDRYAITRAPPSLLSSYPSTTVWDSAAPQSAATLSLGCRQGFAPSPSLDYLHMPLREHAGRRCHHGHDVDFPPHIAACLDKGTRSLLHIAERRLGSICRSSCAPQPVLLAAGAGVVILPEAHRDGSHLWTEDVLRPECLGRLPDYHGHPVRITYLDYCDGLLFLYINNTFSQSLAPRPTSACGDGSGILFRPSSSYGMDIGPRVMCTYYVGLGLATHRTLHWSANTVLLLFTRSTTEKRWFIIMRRRTRYLRKLQQRCYGCISYATWSELPIDNVASQRLVPSWAAAFSTFSTPSPSPTRRPERNATFVGPRSAASREKDSFKDSFVRRANGCSPDTTSSLIHHDASLLYLQQSPRLQAIILKRLLGIQRGLLLA